MKNQKEIFLDDVKNHINANPPIRTMKHTRRIGKLSPLSIGLLCIGLSVAMLTGLLYSIYTIQIQGDLELQGANRPIFEYDHVPFTTQFLNITPDITSISSGQNLSFQHSILNDDAGSWMITITLNGDFSFYTDPMDPWYGFNISVGDYTINNQNVTPENFYVFPHDYGNFSIHYRLDSEFVDTDLPFPVNISIKLERKINTAPEGGNDAFYWPSGGAQSYTRDVIQLCHDDDEFPGVLQIVNCTSLPQYTTQIINNQIVITEVGVPVSGVYILTFYISDGDLSDSATITITKG